MSRHSRGMGAPARSLELDVAALELAGPRHWLSGGWPYHDPTRAGLCRCGNATSRCACLHNTTQRNS